MDEVQVTPEDFALARQFAAVYARPGESFAQALIRAVHDVVTVNQALKGARVDIDGDQVRLVRSDVGWTLGINR